MSNAQTEVEWTIGDRLRKARKVAGVQIAEIALRMGVSRNTPGNYENGRTVPSIEALVAYSDLTGFAMRWLATGEGPTMNASTSDGRVHTGRYREVLHAA